MTIQSAIFRRFAFVLTFAAVTAISSCSKDQKVQPDDSIAAPTAPTIEDSPLGSSDDGKAVGLQTIYFPYDSFVIKGDSKSILKSNAQVLKDKPSMKVQIEGHCDQRGGIQYNIALGEKRANAVKKYLQDLGANAEQLAIISYGKERPMDQGTSEDAYAKNRRANFVVTTR